MANTPIFVDCPKNKWTLVALNVVTGQVSQVEAKTLYNHAYVPTGDAAPVEAEKGIRLNQESILIISDTPVDVYIFANEKEGKVRVDT